jgi:hypothetical protein
MIDIREVGYVGLDSYVEAASSILGVFALMTLADELDRHYEEKLANTASAEMPDQITLITAGAFGSALGGFFGVSISGLISWLTQNEPDSSAILGDIAGNLVSLGVMSAVLKRALDRFVEEILVASDEVYTQEELIEMWQKELFKAWLIGGFAPSVASGFGLQAMESE